jgi:nucleoid DNA-binding protein
MEKKIAALLNSNLRVIVPDFGAFIIRQQQPRIIVFNEELKSNDGLLIEYTMKAEGVEKDVAEQLLSDFLNHAKRLLESGGILSIEGVGELQHDRHGKIIFTTESEIGVTEKARVKKKETVKPVSAKKPVTRSKAKQPAMHEPIIRHAPAETEKAAGTTQEKPEPVMEKPGPAMENPVPPVKNTEPAPEIREPALTFAKPARFWSGTLVKWIIGIILANVFVLTFFILKDNFRNRSQKAQETFGFGDSVLQQLADSVRVAVADSTLIFREEAIVTPLENNKPAEGNLRYYIVAGCFKDEVNADKLVWSLDSLGYKAEKFGKIGDLYAVSFASFDDKELAAKELARIREKVHPDAWLTKF